MTNKLIQPGIRNQSAQTYYSENSFPVSFGNNILKNKQSRKQSKDYRQYKVNEAENIPMQSEEQIFLEQPGLNRQIIQKIYEEDFPKSSVRKRQIKERLNKTYRDVSRNQLETKQQTKDVVKEKQIKQKQRQKTDYFRTKEEIIRAIYNSKLKYKFRDTIRSSLSNQGIPVEQKITQSRPKQKVNKNKLNKLQYKRFSVDNSRKDNKVFASKTMRQKVDKNLKQPKKSHPRVDLSQILNSMPKFDNKQESQLNFPKLLQKQKYHESDQEEQKEQSVSVQNPKRQFKNIVQQSLNEGQEGVIKLINTFQPRTANYSQTDKTSFKMKKYKNGVYFGQLSEQETKSGVGIIFYFNGKLYEGDFKNDMKQGKGYQLYVDNSYYEGEYSMGYKQGKGRFYWSNGQIYDGQWHKGKKHGSGMWKFSITSKKSYIGEWFNGKPHGFGVFFNHLGDRYEGQFKNGLKQGHGTERFVNGDLYVGQFVKGRKTGIGQFRYSNGDIYIGQFCNNLKHGRGKFIEQKTKQIYEGSFRNDNISGTGQYLFSDGTVYQGMFQNNLIHGEGIVTYRDYTSIEGYWINGIKMGGTSRQQNKRYNTIQHQAARQFASIRQKRIKKLQHRQSSIQDIFHSKPKSKSPKKSKRYLRLTLVIQKSQSKHFHQTLEESNSKSLHSKCSCYGHRRKN